MMLLSDAPLSASSGFHWVCWGDQLADLLGFGSVDAYQHRAMSRCKVDRSS
jgi:hypothetical protein